MAPQPQNEASFPPTWVIMPILGAPEYTRAAIADVLAQNTPVKLLIINQGVDDAFREELERIADAHEDRIFLWSHQPPLPSLAATWNTALDYVWAVGGYLALVINNDVRLRPDTIDWLRKIGIWEKALFVSAVGVTAAQFNPADGLIMCDDPDAEHPRLTKGGPDFSCFLISHECHSRYRFDEGFIPAYCEDLDYHRRLLLDGQGHRIFSVNVPYLHYGAATLKTADPGQKAAIERAIGAGSRQHYQRKWGGPVNEETFWAPFDPTIPPPTSPVRAHIGILAPPTTPNLQRWEQEAVRPDPVIDPRD